MFSILTAQDKKSLGKLLSDVERPTFVRVQHTNLRTGAVEAATLLVGIHYRNAVARAKEALTDLNLQELQEIVGRDLAPATPMGIGLLMEAKESLLESFRKTLNGEQKERVNPYASIIVKGVEIPWLKRYIGDKEDRKNFRYISGIKVGQTITVSEGEEMPVRNSAPLTLVKEKIRNFFPAGRIRDFNIAIGSDIKITMNGESWTPIYNGKE